MILTENKSLVKNVDALKFVGYNKFCQQEITQNLAAKDFDNRMFGMKSFQKILILRKGGDAGKMNTVFALQGLVS